MMKTLGLPRRRFIVSLMKDYKVKEVAYDPAFFERSTQVLLDRGVLWSTSHRRIRMIPAR